MYKFPTVKEVIEKLQQCPPDAEVCFGHFDAFLGDDLNPSKPIGLITEKEAYELYFADHVEYGTFYTYHRGSYGPHTCVVISTG